MDDGGEPEWIFCIMLLHSGGLLKEPPYLWQAPSPDGGNLEHWAGRMERWLGGEREERMKGKAEELRFRERKQTPPHPAPPALARRRTNGWGRPGVSVLPALNRCTWRGGLVYDKDGMSWRKGGQRREMGRKVVERKEEEAATGKKSGGAQF